MNGWNLNMADVKAVQTPLNILDALCGELFRLSNQTIIARVSEYDGPYASTEGYNVFNQAVKNIGWQEGFNVQAVMGETGVDEEEGELGRFVYELFITSVKTPKYKYRILILYYGITLYPVGLTIQQDIAKELGCPSEGILCENESEFREMINRIIGSDTVGIVLKNLAAMNL